MERVVLHNAHVADAFLSDGKFWVKELSRLKIWGSRRVIRFCESQILLSNYRWAMELREVRCE